MTARWGLLRANAGSSLIFVGFMPPTFSSSFCSVVSLFVRSPLRHTQRLRCHPSPSLLVGGALIVGLSPVLVSPILAQTPSAPGRAIIRTSPERQAIAAARARALSLIENRIGPVPTPRNPPQEWERWLFSRYRGAGGNISLIASLVHQDLQLAARWLDSPNAVVRRRGVRVAAIANLYAASVEAAGEPRLRASIYDGFLLPYVADAPAGGLGNAPSIREGASVAFRRTGQTRRQIEVLNSIIAQEPRTALADMSRVHLAEALAQRRDYRGAIAQLRAVTTPDLSGALARIPELERLLAQQVANPEPAITGSPVEVPPSVPGSPVPDAPVATPPPTVPEGTGVPPDNGLPGGNAPGKPDRPPANPPAPANPPGEVNPVAPTVPGLGDTPMDNAPVGGAPVDNAPEGLPGGGRPDATVPGGEAAPDGTGETTADEGDRATRMSRALAAAQLAAALTKKAEQAAALSLAKMLDTAEAEEDLEAATQARDAAAPRSRRAGANGAGAAAKPNLAALRTRRYSAAREASAAAETARKATQAAQVATAEAARLAVLVHAVSPQDAQNTAPAPPADPTDALPVAADAAAAPTAPAPTAPAPETAQ